MVGQHQHQVPERKGEKKKKLSRAGSFFFFFHACHCGRLGGIQQGARYALQCASDVHSCHPPSQPLSATWQPPRKKKKKAEPALNKFFFFLWEAECTMGGRVTASPWPSTHHMHTLQSPAAHPRALTRPCQPIQEKKKKLFRAGSFFFFFLRRLTEANGGRQSAMGMEGGCQPSLPTCTAVTQQQQKSRRGGQREKNREWRESGRPAGCQPLGRAAGRPMAGPCGHARAWGGGWRQLAEVEAMKFWQSPL